jgi:hypothetical protein
MIRVTVEDLESGEVKVRELEDDACWVTAGTAYVDSFQAWPNGTVQVVFKGVTPNGQERLPVLDAADAPKQVTL